MAPNNRSSAGDESQIVDVLCKYATVPDWISYGENVQTPLSHTKIVPHRAMWRELASVHPSLQFSQSQIERVLEPVAAKAGSSTWPRALQADEITE